MVGGTVVTGAVLAGALSGGSGATGSEPEGVGLVGVGLGGSGSAGGELTGGAGLVGAAITGASAGGWVEGASGEGWVAGDWAVAGGRVAGACVAGGTSGVSAGRGVLISGKVIVVAASVVFSGEEVAGGCDEESLLEQADKKAATARAAIANLVIFGRAWSESGMITCRLVRHGVKRSHAAAFVAVFPFHQQALGEIRGRQLDCGASDAGSSRVLLQRGRPARNGSERFGGGYRRNTSVFSEQTLGLAQGCLPQRLKGSPPVLDDEPSWAAALHAFRVARGAYFRQRGFAGGCECFGLRDFVAGEVHALRDMAFRRAG